MRALRFLFLLPLLLIGTAHAATSTMGSDGVGIPNVVIYCPPVSPATTYSTCSFGGGSGGGSGGSVTESGTWTMGLTYNGGVVSPTNLLGVTDLALDALISGGKLPVSISTLPALPAGANAIGSVLVSNFPATQPVSAASLPLPAGAATSANQTLNLAPVAPGTATATNSTLLGCAYNTSPPTFTTGQQGAVACDSSGHALVSITTNVPSYLQAVSSGGATMVRSINSASSATATSVKASGGLIYGYSVCNNTGAVAFFRMFNQTSAPTVGTSTPLVGAEPVATGGCARFASDIGLYFTNGIAFDVTTGSMADADTSTIATANQVVVTMIYK